MNQINDHAHTIRGIFVCPDTRSFHELAVPVGDGAFLEFARQVLSCSTVDVARFDGLSSRSEHSCYIDDTGLVTPNRYSRFRFMIRPAQVKGESFVARGYPQWLAGRGLITGFNPHTGEEADCEISIPEIRIRTVFSEIQEH